MPAEDAALEAVIARCRPFTMTSPARMRAVHDAAQYVAAANIPGAFVECGVWRGGSTMVAALAFLDAGASDRELFLYDTFAGMTEPDERDVSYRGEDARARWREGRRDGYNEWCFAPVEEVRDNVAATGYPTELTHLVVGPVEQTIPTQAPAQIAVLRLDTDWYASTKHELEWLYPRLSPGGVLIIDDYGHWRGARAATDDYFREQGITVLLHRCDLTGRVAIKPGTA